MAATDLNLAGTILELIATPLEETGAEMAALIRERLAIPCPPHSTPPDPPHRETGTLQDSVGYAVTTTGPGEMTLTIGAGPALAEDGYDYGPDLEKGTGKMTAPRPYVLDLADDAVQTLIGKISGE